MWNLPGILCFPEQKTVQPVIYFQTFYSMTISFGCPSTCDLWEEVLDNFFLLQGTKIYPSQCKYENLYKNKTKQTAGQLMCISPEAVILHRKLATSQLPLTRPRQHVHGHKAFLALCLSTVYGSYCVCLISFPLSSCLECTCNALFRIYLLVLGAQSYQGIEWWHSEVYFYRTTTFGQMALLVVPQCFHLENGHILPTYWA